MPTKRRAAIDVVQAGTHSPHAVVKSHLSKREEPSPSDLDPLESDAEVRAEDLELSSTDGESDIEAAGIDADIEEAVMEYLHDAHLGQNGDREKQDGQAIEDSDTDEFRDATELLSKEDDAASDSSEEERMPRNTVGDVPLSWYKHEDHIGYDRDGARIVKMERSKDALDRLLERNEEGDAAWRTIYDAYNDEEIVLSKEEMRMIQRIRSGRFPHTSIDPFEPENDWFTRHTEVMALSAAPEPKSRFVPSKWEEKRVVKLVRAMRKGWLKRDQESEKAPEVYMLWKDDGAAADKTQAGLTYIPAPKLKLPGHEESYNPPPEYIPTEEEKNATILEAEAEGRPVPFVPQAFDALRRVPAYSNYIRERFERCLDLYLCPRARVKRLDVKDPEALVPKLPKPKDLQPFPAVLAIEFSGHSRAVRSLSTDPSGRSLLSGSEDGSVKLWEVRTGRCLRTWSLSRSKESEANSAVVTSVAWCPNPHLSLAAVAIGKDVVLLPLECCNKTKKDETMNRLAESLKANAANAGSEGLVTWEKIGEEDASGAGAAIRIKHQFDVSSVQWHISGDYFCSVAPKGNTRSVLVHQLSRGASQNPFRKNRGRVVAARFHPSKPFFFVATQQAVRVYNLAKQSLAKKLVTGGGVLTSFDVHPTGDHVIVGSEDRRLAWYDLDLSPRPYRSLKYHAHAVRGTAFHRSYPLFASTSDDATVHVFHGMVYADMMTNPLIVPVKILRGHSRASDSRGVLDVVFHPNQPWCFTAGADSRILLFVNP